MSTNSNGSKLVIAGSGFAGVWAALAAARRRKQLGANVEITVVSPNAFMGMRPRYYEPDLARSKIELSYLFDPVGIEHVCDKVTGIDKAGRYLTLETGRLHYDALIWAIGSAITPPSLDGARHLFSVDTFADAEILSEHLRNLPEKFGGDHSSATVVVVGAGFTGIETATEMVSRLRETFGGTTPARVMLIEKSPTIGPDFGPRARATIATALADMGVEIRVSTTLTSITNESMTLSTGEVIQTRTVVWTGGVRADERARLIGPPADPEGRLRVDATLRVLDSENIWAAGDVAHVLVDGVHPALMSCQHAIPQGKYAGHNAMSWLTGSTMKRYAQSLYLTCLDLGPRGGLVTLGFERDDIVCSGSDGKAFKQFINTDNIYPPLDGNVESMLRAAKPPSGGRTASAFMKWMLRSRLARSSITGRAGSGPAALEEARKRGAPKRQKEARSGGV
jgi:NADH dehydrogenase